MADDVLLADVDDMSKLRAKYERSETNLKCLEKLAIAAVQDYESLQLKYEQNQQQYEQLRERLIETEEKLASLQSVLEPACNEFNNLNDQLQVEKACRSEAEKFASRKHKENSKLKRQSQMLLDKLSTHNIADVQSTLEMITDAEETSEDTADGNNSVQQSHSLNEKIALLEKDIKELEAKLHQSETQRAASIKAESDVKKKCSRLEAELFSVCKRLDDHEQTMRIFSQASHRAFGEFSELKDKYEEQMQLTSAAELFAHKMYRDNEALKRQSTVLMDKDVLGDARLMKALMEIEDLTRQLESVKQENKSRIESFEKSLLSDENIKKINDLEIELQLMSSEVARLQKALDDTEEWKEKLNKENENLRTKIDDIMRPPPPPPPPPCLLLPCITSTKLVINKQPTSAEIMKGSDRLTSRPARNAPAADVNGALMSEMKEMMRRIETGNVLKPGGTIRNRPPNIRPSPAESPMNELQNLLNKMGKRSDKEESKLVSPSTLIGRQTSSSPSPAQSRTFKALYAQDTAGMPPSPTSRVQPTTPSPSVSSQQSSAADQEASQTSASVKPPESLGGSKTAAAAEAVPRVSTVNRSSSQLGTPPVTLPKPTRSNSQRSSSTLSQTVASNGTLPSVDENKMVNRTSTRQSNVSKTPDCNTNL